jgi:hypothetical protein
LEINKTVIVASSWSSIFTLPKPKKLRQEAQCQTNKQTTAARETVPNKQKATAARGTVLNSIVLKVRQRVKKISVHREKN